MNKTLTINVSGIIFHIEEDAYEKLNKYLSTIKGYFSSADGGNEIMTDIEARVAELLQERINPGKQVILLADVEHVMQVMGKPEEFSDSPNASGQSATEKETGAQYQDQKIKKRLFRDPDDKAVGGVCSGLAAYFDIDVVWVRLAMFLLVFFGGVSLWVYIILWMVIPEARTVGDRLAMRGESANINNIIKNFKEEAEDVKNRVDKYGKEFKSRNYGEAVRNNVFGVANSLIGLIGRLLGFFILCVGLFFLVVYLAALAGISVLDSSVYITEWKRAVFESSSDYLMALVCFAIVVGIPVFMLIYAGIKLLFKIQYSNRWINLSLGLVWLIGLGFGVFISFRTVRHYNQNARIRENYELHGVGDTLVIRVKPAAEILKVLKPDNEDDAEMYLMKHHGGYFFPEYDGQQGIIGFPEINVVETEKDSVEIAIIKNAKGLLKKDANENAKEIKYTYEQQKNEIVFDELFFVPPGNKFRFQEVDIRIRLPKGKVIYLDKSVKHRLHDVDNVTNTWDGDMAGRRWKMTARGLECIDCEGLNSENDKDEDDEIKKVEINNNGIKVNGEDARIKIDGDGIVIKTPEKEYKITDDEKKTKETKKSDGNKEQEEK